MIPSSALLTDLYQLTMLQGYYEQSREEPAVFEFFVRKLPKTRGYMVAAGLAQALIYLQELQFSSNEIDWLASTGHFKPAVLDRLAAFRFTGDVHAMPEGTVFFPHEPILRITAPLPEAQLVESRLINLLHFQTLIASKAARSVLIAPDKLLVDFGMRRAHGSEAALLAARASYLAGFGGTATVNAGMYFDIPVYGTMAHSFVQTYSSESEAFIDFAKANPDNVVLLIDTYDTEAAAQKIVDLADTLHSQGIKIKGVRIDSGDLAEHAIKVRRILDRGGLQQATIFASGSVDEYKLEALMAQQAPIDGFGIGTHLDTSADAPYFDCAYKLQEYAGIARRKRSEGKATWPGRKQVYRNHDDNGFMLGDTVTVENAPCTGEPLLQPVMQAGRIVTPQPSLMASRGYAKKQLSQLPEALRRLSDMPEYPVVISAELQALAKSVDEQTLL
ncbi:nicotinate phosphoribosyltransferase [Methylobacter sp. YRD-M1]|uniref:nicotinate phosphoribosyltransferase n=1 Tax=Methylobacter sp. YRD-M1 TaxID=2911520 RepID=UPI00227BEE0E|nr:nicotinate phosphoribosyltransferase [Methylobacter sp. YRD-M1]WAK04051.1 nicotinate phosphoribosyltransferase [Methylobacter sp. YRD-M1]